LTRFGNHGDCCFGPYTLAAFREWLQGRYASLDALNAEWDTTYKAWKDVVPMTRIEARAHPSYAPWADHRTFMETAWADAYRRYRDIVHGMSPFSFIGNGGSQVFQADNGLDYWKFFRVWEQAQARASTTWYVKFYRTFPGAPIVTPYKAIGWNRQDGEARYGVWKHAFELRGAGDSAYPSIKKVAPDLSISKSGRSCEEITRPLRNGVGKLLRHLEIVGDGVAIHYSQPSVHGEFIIGRAENITKAQSAWVHVLRDLGIDPAYVSYAQVEAGELIGAGYKVFIMPFSVAVSRKEVDQITRFVRQGGVVIGDAMTGMMDGHCKPWKPSPLDDVFGIERSSDPVGRSGKMLVRAAGPLKSMERGFVLLTPFVENGLKPTTGRVLARSAEGGPGLICNDYGKGKAVRLGFLLSDYPSTPRLEANRREEVLRMVQGVLDLAGVPRRVQVLDKDGKPLPFCETWRFRRGEALYVGVLREDKTGLKTQIVDVGFPESRHVYDILEADYVGRAGEASKEMYPASPAFFALFREKVKGVLLEARPNRVDLRARRPELEVRYEAAVTHDGGSLEDHALRIDVYGPEGEVRHHYGANLWAPEGRATSVIRFALNDPPGLWKIVCRDVVSGLSASAEITLQ